MRGSLYLLFFFLLSLIVLTAPVSAATIDQRQAKQKKYTFGLLPALDYSSDKGLGYGILFQLDDKRSPEYQPYYLSHRLVFQRTTKGIADYYYRLDSKYLLPAGLKITLEVKYVASLFEPYHGPGGAQTLYNADFADPDADAAVYRGKYYYNYDKCYTRINTLIQGKLQGEHLRWLAGLYLLSTAVDTIDYTDYDEDPGQTLLANHWDYRQAAMAGGQENALVAGIIYDRRDHEATPHRGVWSELLVRWIPDALGNDFSYTAITATHRQYLPISNELTFAYRLSGRSISAGAPFFSTPQVDGTYKTEEGLGGKKTVRGVLWQRVNGFNAVYGNLELRYRVMSLLETGYAALSIFYDLGRTFDEIPESTLFDRGQDHDVWHQGVGGGVRIAPNNTFIVALDLAVPVDSAMDGPGLKVYVGLDWLF